MDFFLKYKIVILRTLGGVMLIVGFAVHFWTAPTEVISANDKAAARVARMEANVRAAASSSALSQKEKSKYLNNMKDAQAEQMRYITIIAMLLGLGSIISSFIPKKEEDEI